MRPIILFLNILLLISCNQKKEKPSFEINRLEKTEVTKQPDLTGIFVLKTVNDSVFNMSDYYGFEATQPYLTFDTTSMRASGHSGCNGFTAPFKISDSQIEFTEPPLRTEIGCEDDNAWENQLYDLLSHQSVKLNGNELVVKNDTTELLFSKE